MARWVVDALWIGLLFVMLWRLPGKLRPETLRAGLLVLPFFFVGQYLIYRYASGEAAAVDTSIGIAVFSFGIVTGFDLSQLAGARDRLDGKPGRFARRPVLSVLLTVVLVIAMYAVLVDGLRLLPDG